MTRDGLIEQDLSTGEEIRISQRGQDFQLRQGQLPDAGQPGAAQALEGQPEIRRDIPLRRPAARDNPGAEAGQKNRAAYRSWYIEPSASPAPDSWQAADARAEAPPSAVDAAEQIGQEEEAAGYPEGPRIREGAEHSAPSGVPPKKAPASPARQHGTGYARKFTPEAGGSPATGAEQTGAPKAGAEPAKPGRLQFDHGERTPAPSPHPDKKLERLQSRAEAVNAKLEQAREKLPTKTKGKRTRVYDEQKGKARRELRFEKEPLAPGQKRITPPAVIAGPAAAGKAGAHMAAQGVHQGFHRKLYEVERENAGVQAAHRGEMAAEGAARLGGRSVRAAYRFHRSAPYRAVEKLEKEAGRANSRLLFHKAAGGAASPTGSALSRAAQKRGIQKRYGHVWRSVSNAAKRTGKAFKKTGENIAGAAKTAVSFAAGHPAVAGIIGGILLVVFFFFSMLSSCMNMATGGLSTVVASSYAAPDAEIEDAGLAYAEWETDLREQIENAETDHDGYDEYRYDVDMDAIGHDPFALMAWLTARYQDFAYSDVEAELREIFAEQYSLTYTPEIEMRHGDPDDEDGDGDTEPYEWRILNIKLETKPFSEVLAGRMDGAQTELFDVYMETRGNRQYLANPFAFDWQPYISCLYGWRIHPITGARDYHTGLDIAAAAGTPILAGQDGVISFSGSNGDYGLLVQIDGGDGLSSRYAHCSEILASVGQAVKKGDIIAKVGSTGASTGPHLHLEVIVNGQRLNPVYFAESK